MHNKERAVSLELSNGTCSRIQLIWMFVKVVIYTRKWRSYVGRDSLGREILEVIGDWQKNHIIAITIAGSCVKKLATDRITEAGQRLSQPKPKSIFEQ